MRLGHVGIDGDMAGTRRAQIAKRSSREPSEKSAAETVRDLLKRARPRRNIKGPLSDLTGLRWRKLMLRYCRAEK